MISLIEARRFRCLKYIRQELGPFHVLVGPNASGKTTFLDVISFMGQFVSSGLEAALEERSNNFIDLVWCRKEPADFQLAVEARLPDEIRGKLQDRSYNRIRYELHLGIDPKTKEISIKSESGILRKGRITYLSKRSSFPTRFRCPSNILTQPREINTRRVFSKSVQSNDNYYSEVKRKPNRAQSLTFKLGTRKSTLGNLPEDETQFPAATWLKQLLREGVQELVLNSSAMRKACPPGKVSGFRPDGSNLPWVIEDLRKRDSGRFRDWLLHLQTTLTDLTDIRTVERPEDKHRYLVLSYRGGLDVPSWTASDGTLRLLALTLPAYLPGFEGIYLIEEPENGIHPTAVSTMYRALSCVYGAQILVATHSPVILSEAEPESVLCFARNNEGATDIVRGSEHPMLEDWQRDTNLGVLFAAGVLS